MRSFVNDLPLARALSQPFQILEAVVSPQMRPQDQDLFARLRRPIRAKHNLSDRQGIWKGLDLRYGARMYP